MEHTKTTLRSIPKKEIPPTVQFEGQDIEIDCLLGDYDISPLIPDAHYIAGLVKVEQKTFFKSKKIILWFQIVEGVHEGKRLLFAVNVPRDGRWRNGHKYLRAWVLANEGMLPKRRSKLSTNVFKHKYFEIQTRTVTLDQNKNFIPISMRYSVISAIIRKI